MIVSRYVVIGLGAIGGTVAAMLDQSGQSVVGIARGPHLTAIRSRGLTLRTPGHTRTVSLTTASDIKSAGLCDQDVVLLCTKSQDTAGVVSAIRETGCQPSLFCLQNGVENERIALRVLRSVYGGMVAMPAAYEAPGEISVYCGPQLGVIELGCAPVGSDDLCEAVARDLCSSNLIAKISPDIAASKYGKLLWNLGNAARAAFASDAMVKETRVDAQKEARACYVAAGLKWTDGGAKDLLEEEGLSRLPINGNVHPGGSTWQSLRRGSQTETDYLNGEIVLLGRLYSVPTPVNAVLVEVIHLMAKRKASPGSFDPDQFKKMLNRASESAAL